MFNQKRIFKITYIVDISAAGLLQNEVKTVRVQWLYEKPFFHVTIVPELFSLHFEEGLRPKYQQFCNFVCNFEDSFLVKHTRIRSIQMIYFIFLDRLNSNSTQIPNLLI